MFDIENDVFDPDLGIKVYLWGLMIIDSKGPREPVLIVSPKGVEGDEAGWNQFLDNCGCIFNKFGDLPFVHYATHEKTWVSKYIERYGDPNEIAARVESNLWDMYKAITASLVLPTPAYSLKQVEELAGFKRSQEEYGGLWSIITYDRYLNAKTEAEAQETLNEILLYNREDIMASYAVYKWLENQIR